MIVTVKKLDLVENSFKERRLHLSFSHSIKDIANEISEKVSGIYYRGKLLGPNDQPRLLGIDKLIYTTANSSNNSTAEIQIVVDSGEKTLAFPKHILKQAIEGLAHGIKPKLSTEGTAGTYFMMNVHHKPVAIYKPQDEEACSRNNPRLEQNCNHHQISESRPRVDSLPREGFLPQESAAREVAAFLLDDDNFCGVPPTILVEGPGKKVGSFQAFVDTSESVGNIAPNRFPTSQVHKIGILDIRIMNTDRNDANLLVVLNRESCKTGVKLIPIDHGYSLPDKLNVAWCDWCWADWPQTTQPFNQETMDWIARLDPEKDAIMLREQLGIREECIRIMRISTCVLKVGAARGLTLREITCLIMRDDIEKPSIVENIVTRAEELVLMMKNNSRSSPKHLSNSIRRVSSFPHLPSYTINNNITSEAGSFPRSNSPTNNNSKDDLFMKYFYQLLDDSISERLENRTALSRAKSVSAFDGESMMNQSTKLASPRLTKVSITSTLSSPRNNHGGTPDFSKTIMPRVDHLMKS